MFGTHSSNLSAEDQKQLHPQYLANEKDYVVMRDSLLPQYKGQWVAIDGGRVVAAAPKLMDLIQAPSLQGGFPYIACLGEEDDVVFRASTRLGYRLSFQS